MEDKEKWRIYRKRWRDKNKEKIKEYNKKYNEEHKEHSKKYQKEYHRVYDKTRGREKYLIRQLTYYKYREKIIAEREKCEVCGSMKKLELHHKNYEVDTEAIQLLCRDCHKKVHKN